MTAVISASHVALGYGNHAVIHDFNCEIGNNQFVGVFGANGAGKTTLLRTLLGLIPPLKGELHVLGNTPNRGHPDIGYVPQIIPNPGVSISGYALLAACVNGNKFGLPILGNAQHQEIARVLQLVGAEHYAQRSFADLSGGEKRRLLIGQALMGKPKILLLDEPLANLDPHYQHVLIELLDKIRKELGITVLVTAHDVNSLLTAMTQVLYFAKGRAILGSVDAVITSKVLSELYGSAVDVIRHNGRILVMHSITGQDENVHCH